MASNKKNYSTRKEARTYNLWWGEKMNQNWPRDDTDIGISRQEYQIVIIFYIFKKLGRHMEDIKKELKLKPNFS